MSYVNLANLLQLQVSEVVGEDEYACQKDIVFVKDIMSLPIDEDVIRITRCKKCIYGEPEVNNLGKPFVFNNLVRCSQDTHLYNSDHYCEIGKRKNEQ